MEGGLGYWIRSVHGPPRTTHGSATFFGVTPHKYDLVPHTKGNLRSVVVGDLGGGGEAGLGYRV